MAGNHTYLDYNATAPVRPEVSEAVARALSAGGNPSSVHAAGRRARALVEDAREEVARLVGAAPSDVVFTSGATESNTTALSPRSDGALLVAAVDHPSVVCGGRFPADRVETIPVDGNGVVRLDWLERRLSSGGPVDMVSVGAACGETGVVQPVARVAGLARAAGAVVHCDAAQAVGRLPLDMHELGVDLMSVSAHKIGGPQGVGAHFRRSDAQQMRILVRGGGQERGLRAGTENVPGIAGFGVAARLAREEPGRIGEIARLRDWLEAGIRAISPDATIFGAGGQRVANTVCFALPMTYADRLVIALDLAGIAASAGSACSSGKVGPSHVLAAMGIDPQLSRGALRLSLGWASTGDDVQRFLAAWRRVAAAAQNNRGEAA